MIPVHDAAHPGPAEFTGVFPFKEFSPHHTFDDFSHRGINLEFGAGPCFFLLPTDHLQYYRFVLVVAGVSNVRAQEVYPFFVNVADFGFLFTEVQF